MPDSVKIGGTVVPAANVASRTTVSGFLSTTKSSMMLIDAFAGVGNSEELSNVN